MGAIIFSESFMTRGGTYKANIHENSCECGHDWCFLCGGAWTPHGCEQSCPPYGGQDVRVPMRQRQFRYRQGRHERDNTQRNPSQLEPPALQALLPQIQGILPAEQQQIFVAPHPGQIELVNQPMQNIIVQPIPQGESGSLSFSW